MKYRFFLVLIGPPAGPRLSTNEVHLIDFDSDSSVRLLDRSNFNVKF